jgi:hypothetical protein
VREQDADARPAIANPRESIDRYDTVRLASPIWNVRAPMNMTTFAEGYDFSDKALLAGQRYAMSGLGTTPDDYAQSCRGARIGNGPCPPRRGGPVRRDGRRLVAAPQACSTAG